VNTSLPSTLIEICHDCLFLSYDAKDDPLREGREHCGTCDCCEESRDPFDPVEPYDGK